LIKNSQPFGKKFQKTVGGIFLTHTVYRPNPLQCTLFPASRVVKIQVRIGSHHISHKMLRRHTVQIRFIFIRQ